MAASLTVNLQRGRARRRGEKESALTNTNPAQGAVIYTRVACANSNDATPLSVQEALCRAHAERQGLNVINTFGDVGSGIDPARAGLAAMLRYLGERRDERLTVVVADMDRLTRNLASHVGIVDAIHSAGGAIQTAGISR